MGMSAWADELYAARRPSSVPCVMCGIQVAVLRGGAQTGNQVLCGACHLHQHARPLPAPPPVQEPEKMTKKPPPPKKKSVWEWIRKPAL